MVRMSKTVHFKLYPEERTQIEEAISVSPAAWRGISFYARQAVLAWASSTLAHHRANKPATMAVAALRSPRRKRAV